MKIWSWSLFNNVLKKKVIIYPKKLKGKKKTWNYMSWIILQTPFV
jgi:hypothetical protein